MLVATNCLPGNCATPPRYIPYSTGMHRHSSMHGQSIVPVTLKTKQADQFGTARYQTEERRNLRSILGQATHSRAINASIVINRAHQAVTSACQWVNKHTGQETWLHGI